ncbi:hypothetical protein FRC12_007443 [Ceratobasidium sp. 428]|nr:hypothetical protein FRC12_007443 [Ceratobasidium sp. 428]
METTPFMCQLPTGAGSVNSIRTNGWLENTYGSGSPDLVTFFSTSRCFLSFAEISNGMKKKDSAPYDGSDFHRTRRAGQRKVSLVLTTQSQPFLAKMTRGTRNHFFGILSLTR